MPLNICLMTLLNFHERLIVFPLILVALGLLLRYWIGRRKFNRRSLTGLQTFARYSNAVITLMLERLMLWIANILIFAAIALYLMK